MSTDIPVDILVINKRTVVHAYESLVWMIQAMEFTNRQTGLEQGPSPELFKAINTRDKLRKVLYD
jgi:hypothetical protein